MNLSLLGYLRQFAVPDELVKGHSQAIAYGNA